MNGSTGRALAGEFLGTAFLVATVVGSGTMAERLAAGNVALALLANSFATGCVLITLIFTFGPISGAHFNPVVTLAMSVERVFRWRDFPLYVGSQIAGAFAGVVMAHAMFDLPFIQVSVRERNGLGQLVSEFVATFGLVLVIHGAGKKAGVVPLTVAAYVAAAYWFTASTSFANPAVTAARALTATFAGIRMADVVPFVSVQVLAALVATLVFRGIRIEDPGELSDE